MDTKEAIEVADSLSTQLLRGDFEFPCPVCEVEVWARYAEVVAGCAVLCPVCRTRVWLQDDRGGMQNAGSDIESDIERIFKGMFG